MYTANHCIGFGTKGPSGNVKLSGVHTPRPVYAIYRPVGDTCPADCALLGSGCYAQGGNVDLHQRRAAARTFDPVAWASRLPSGAIVRLCVSGDFVGVDGPAFRAGVSAAAVSRPDVLFYGYSHAWADPSVASWAASLPSNCTVVASLDDPAERWAAIQLGWRTRAVAVPTASGKGFTDSEARAERAAGRLACPAQRVDIGCADCLACVRPGDVSFAIHGPSHRRARAALTGRRGLPVLD
jgi:hypothetical protein